MDTELVWERDEVRTVPILVNHNNRTTGTFTLDYIPPNRHRVTLDYAGQTFLGESWNYWSAFNVIRELLEPQGVRFLCYGASQHCHPSGMTLDMGEGLWVYKMTMGKVARQKDLVHLFEIGEDVIPATVAEQSAFYEAWWESPAEG